jgi:hypothetical protein
MSSIRDAGCVTRGTEWQAWDGDGGPSNVPAEPFPFVPLVALTAHPRVKRESIGLRHPFQSATRAVQGPNGANHERFVSLLWADSSK